VPRIAELVAPSRLGRSFRWLLASSWVTNLGDGITLAAGPLLVASVTRDPLAVAMAALLQRLPWLLFGLYAGVVADRLDRRAIVIVTGLVRVAILVLLTTLIVTHHVDIALVLTVLFLFGVTETFGDTTTGTLLPMGSSSGTSWPGHRWAPCCSRPGGRCRSSARACACWPACC
jgi:MFS family permease